MHRENLELLEHAAALCEAGKFADASTVLRAVVRRDSCCAEAWVLLARSELGAERYEPALEAAERACLLSPESKIPYLAASLALLRLRRFGEAVADARKAVSLDPFDWRALGILARALASEKPKAPEAREAADRMVALASREPEAHLTAGFVAAAAGDREEARRFFRKVLELDPPSSAAQHELARLRLKHRVNGPAVLADAAAGFARAAFAGPVGSKSQASLEAVLRLFMSRTAYLLLVDAYLVGRVSATSTSAAARLLPPLLLLIPAFYAWRFLSHLTKPLRGHLLGILTRERPLQLAAGLECLAVLSVLAAAVAPSSVRTGMAGVAAVTALLGRVVLYTQVEHSSRTVRGGAPQPAIRPGLLWVLVALMGLIVLALLLAVAREGGGVGAALLAVAFAGGVALLIRVARRGRSHGAG